MINSKQRAQLRALANTLDTIFQVGKDGIGDELIKSVSEALEKREMIKLRVLENSELSAKEAAEKLSAATKSEVVQVIGTRFVLFRRNPDAKKRRIEIEL